MIAVIIPTGKGREDKFKKCTDSLAKSSYTAWLLYEVNGDKGFTKAVNAGLMLPLSREEHQSSLEYYLVLNDDTCLFPDAIWESIGFMAEHPKCGIMGFCNLRMENPDLIIWGGSGKPFPAGQHKIGRISLGDLQVPTKERWVTFSGVFIRPEVVREIGLLDENLTWICSDSDYSYRARYAGWECWYNPKAKILHEHGVSGKPTKKLVNRFKLDQMAFANKWINGKLFFDLDNELL